MPFNQNSSTSNSLHEAETLCKAIHGNDPFTIVAFKRQKHGEQYGDYSAPKFQHAPWDEQLPYLKRLLAQGYEPFVAAGYMDGQGHGNRNVSHMWSIAVDFDDGLPRCLQDNAVVAPTYVVETSPGHSHALWILDRPCPPDEASRISKVMAIRLGGDLAFAKSSQMIRVPGFWNAKRDFVARLVEPRKSRNPFSLDFLCHAFDVDLICNSLKSAVPRLDDSLGIPKRPGHEQDDIAKMVADLEDALPYLKNYADDYGSWVSTLMAFVPLGAKGRRLAEDFSKLSHKYDLRAFEKKWESIQNNPGHVSTLFLHAQQNGWKNPGRRDNPPLPSNHLTEREFARMIAEELADDYAVELPDTLDKGKPIFYKWCDTHFCRLDEIECRSVIERAGKAVISVLKERGLGKEATSRLAHHIGKRRTLSDTCVDVAEAMANHSKTRGLRHHPYLCMKNGVLNLLTQELVPPRFRPIPMGGMCGVEFDPDATAPTFMTTLQEIFEGNDSLVHYLLRVFGYMLLGKPIEQIFIIFFGDKAENGKSVIQDVLIEIMGSYATPLATSAILTKSHVSDGATPSIAVLEGKRLAVVSENNAKHTLDSAAVKQMTGDRYLPVRKMYGDPKVINIEFLLLMVTNYMPKVTEDDNGLWRRIRLIPFNRSFADSNNKHLADQLRQELPGILNLLLA